MRKFGIILLLLVFSVAIFQFEPQGFVLDSSTSTPSLNATKQTLDDVTDLKDISISLNPETYSDSLEFEELSDNDATSIEAYSTLLIEELGKYDSKELNSTGLNSIYLVKNLQILTSNSNSYAVAGATDYSTSSIFIDVTTNQEITDGTVRYTPARDCDDTEFARGILHHELWHVYEQNNPDVVEYDYSKDYMSVNSLSVASERCMNPNAEFVSRYAQSSAAEDRAEQFRAKMTFMEIE